MLSLLLAIIFIIVFSKVLNYIGKDNISEFLWAFYTRYLTFDPTVSKLAQLQSQAVKVYKARSNTSAKDEFARWAKLDREYGKLKTEIDKLTAALQTRKTSFKSVVKMALFALSGGSKMFVRLWYRKTPVFWLPPNIFPSYVLWILSFGVPTGAVSVTAWMWAVEKFLAALESIGKEVIFEYKHMSELSSSANPTPIAVTTKEKSDL